MSVSAINPLIKLGAQLTACEGGSENTKCPGVGPNGCIRNEPQSGFYPRGLFCYPKDDFSNITAIVVSEKPGDASLFERLSFQLAAELYSGEPEYRRYSNLYARWANHMTSYCHEIAHYRKLLEVLGLLFPGSNNVYLFTELVGCQARVGVNLTKETVDFCSSLHLEQQLKTLLQPNSNGNTPMLIFLGKPAKDWFEDYKDQASYKAIALPHPSGANNGVWSKLFAKGNEKVAKTKKLHADIQEQWDDFQTTLDKWLDLSSPLAAPCVQKWD